MDISENPHARKAIISLVLAGSCPEGYESKLKALRKWADSSKDELLLEVQQYLISEAERLIENSSEFDRYYQKSINQFKALDFLETKHMENL